jgi:hypothetical protein
MWRIDRPMSTCNTTGPPPPGRDPGPATTAAPTAARRVQARPGRLPGSAHPGVPSARSCRTGSSPAKADCPDRPGRQRHDRPVTPTPDRRTRTPDPCNENPAEVTELLRATATGRGPGSATIRARHDRQPASTTGPARPPRSHPFEAGASKPAAALRCCDAPEFSVGCARGQRRTGRQPLPHPRHRPTRGDRPCHAPARDNPPGPPDPPRTPPATTAPAPPDSSSARPSQRSRGPAHPRPLKDGRHPRTVHSPSPRVPDGGARITGLPRCNRASPMERLRRHRQQPRPLRGRGFFDHGPCPSQDPGPPPLPRPIRPGPCHPKGDPDLTPHGPGTPAPPAPDALRIKALRAEERGDGTQRS